MYPLGFTGAEKAQLEEVEPVRHRLRQLEAWLDYAVELGCSGLLLGPIFAAETQVTRSIRLESGRLEPEKTLLGEIGSPPVAGADVWPGDDNLASLANRDRSVETVIEVAFPLFV